MPLPEKLRTWEFEMELYLIFKCALKMSCLSKKLLFFKVCRTAGGATVEVVGGAPIRLSTLGRNEDDAALQGTHYKFASFIVMCM